MVEIRAVEECIQGLYTDGHVRGSTHLANGQEAIAVGIASIIRTTDTVTCTYRGHAFALALGISPEAVLGEICGRAIGCAGGVGGSMHLSDRTVGLMPTFAIVGAGVPVALGAALTAQTLGTDDIAVAVFGDGASNIGAIHESMNLASVWKLPVVFVVENNLYGEYSALRTTTPTDDLAVRAAGYDIPSLIIDGQDIDVVRASTIEAVARARSGQGPTLIEAKTYRYSGHSRSDPATYRPDGELALWMARDPIDIASKALSSTVIEARRAAVLRDVQEAVATVLRSPPPELSAAFEHVTSTLGPDA
ncbi:thiamine pyrophosphate-dependent dehydrogenase E1 component subunit alpha [Gemmatimonas sp.]|uniref:thiamine pyrophosphate-dependent dehydrogenase E1 component subunit alpha n=1 Tax=Gemmatimonas sp. TaxID=1962908 RepID=UPI0035623773